jgi:hypothetical protein
MDKAVDRVHASVDRPGALGPPWTDGGADRGGEGHAHRSSAFGRSGAPKLTGRGATERGAHGELGLGLTGARAVSRRMTMTVKARRCRCSVRGFLRRGERGKEVGRGAVKLGGGARLL